MARSKKESPILPRSRSAGWITWLSAVAMSFLVVLALAAGLAAGRLAADWGGAFDATATVRVTGEAATLDARVRRAAELLAATPGIARARVLERDELVALVSPWLGQAAALEGLPLPRLIALRLDGAGPDRAALQARLEKAVEGAVYDDHNAWAAPLARAALSVAGLAWTAAALVLLVAVTMVALAARAMLARHAEVVRVLRVVGAEDGTIAAAFTRRLSGRSAGGALVGTALALGALWLLPEIGLDAALKPVLLPGLGGTVMVLLAVPAGAALLVWATARGVVARRLARMP